MIVPIQQISTGLLDTLRTYFEYPPLIRHFYINTYSLCYNNDASDTERNTKEDVMGKLSESELKTLI